MRRLKLVLGTYNSRPIGTAQEQFEKAYQYSYKPFLTVLYKYAMLKGTFHFSGALLEWLDEKHPEFIMVLNEMIKRKQIELLGGGFYSPIFPIIPSRDRLGQIELLTTFIRRKFGKRPRGCWITEGVWEPGITSTIKSSGMEYLFLDDTLLLHGGKTPTDLYKPYITDDQGKTAIILPIHNEFISSMFVDSPESVVEKILSLQESNSNGLVLNILLNGDFFLVNNRHYSNFFAEGGWLEKFLSGLTTASAQIETILPGRFVRNHQPLERVYLPSQFSRNGDRNGQDEKREKLNIYPISTFVSDRNRLSYFRQYISQYPEIHRIYSKMMYVHLIVGQVRGDRSRKKSAKEESYRGQTNTPFWNGPDGGIYRNQVRKAVYGSLINAERTTREKGIFSTSINVSDIDLDGMPEYLYQGQFLNAYVHRRGAALFELDYVVTAWNYLDTMARKKEAYHTETDEINGIDSYTKNSFLDHFFDKSFTIDDFSDGRFTEETDLLNSLYRVRKVEKERKEVSFGLKKLIGTEHENRIIDIFKDYDFSKNSITVKYRLTGESRQKINGRFGVELNLSFPEQSEGRLGIVVRHTEGESELEGGKAELHNVNEIVLHDRFNRTMITISTDNPASFWTFPVFTVTEQYGKKVWIYQHTTCVFSWETSLSSEMNLAASLCVRIEKK